MLVSIVIITFNNLHKTINCIQSIRQFTHQPYELIFVDNGSADDTVEYLRQLEGVRLIENTQNRGFAAGCNQGMAAAKGDHIMLLNNDTIVSHRWLDNLLAALHSSPDIGIVGPKSNWVIPIQTVKPTYASEAEYHLFADAFNRHDPSKWQIVTSLSGFCILFSKSLFDTIGRMDESFIYGVYEDTDFCYRAFRAGYSLLIAGDTFVHHEGNSGFKGGALDMHTIAAHNRRNFLKKWGVDPDRMAYAMDEAFLIDRRAETGGSASERASRLPGGILIKGSAPEVYLLERGKKRLFASSATFEFLRFKWDRIVTLPDDELRSIPDGIGLNAAGVFPAYFPKTLVAKGSGSGVYLIANGILIPIASEEDFASLQFSADDIVTLPDHYISSQFYGYGPALTFGNAFEEYELIDYRCFAGPDGKSYYSEGQKLRCVQSDKLFEFYKWKPGRLIRLSDAQFRSFSLGRPIAAR